MRLLRARRSAELGKVASGSATQGLRLRDRKVGSQVIGVDRSRVPGRKQLGKLEEDENEKEELATERRREYIDSELDLGEREEQVACNASEVRGEEEAKGLRDSQEHKAVIRVQEENIKSGRKRYKRFEGEGG